MITILQKLIWAVQNASLGWRLRNPCLRHSDSYLQSTFFLSASMSSHVSPRCLRRKIKKFGRDSCHHNLLVTGMKLLIRWLQLPICDPHTEDVSSVAFLPFNETTYTHISKIISRHNNVMAGIPPTRKDDIALESS